MRQNKGKRKSSEDLVVTSVKRLNAKPANGNRKRKQPLLSFGVLSETDDKEPSPRTEPSAVEKRVKAPPIVVTSVSDLASFRTQLKNCKETCNLKPLLNRDSTAQVDTTRGVLAESVLPTSGGTCSSRVAPGTSLNQNRFVRNFNGAVTSHVGPGEERLINRENPTALVDAFNSQSKASHVVAFVSPLRETFVLLTCATGCGVGVGVGAGVGAGVGGVGSFWGPGVGVVKTRTAGVGVGAGVG
ncbi:DNA-binding protein [Culex quinquefasciatus]|uniref:DNA-binding protein n=1 Tax=Culex quinquefasciatus TaxID=7176 RepID=B0W0F4_CULQU|nr:DNA-binding protein [Culex quinquefasciatus]|eukprot:XP_001842188.1 DNA-binding protein [Culex quinquefasciatus]